MTFTEPRFPDAPDKNTFMQTKPDTTAALHQKSKDFQNSAFFHNGLQYKVISKNCNF